MPDTTGGVVFIDIKNLMPLIQGFAGLSRRRPAQRRRSTTCARCAPSWPGLKRTGETRSFDAFLEIK